MVVEFLTVITFQAFTYKRTQPGFAVPEMRLEGIYFSRPESFLPGQELSITRKPRLLLLRLITVLRCFQETNSWLKPHGIY